MHILLIPSWYPTPQQPLYGIFFKEQAVALQKFGHHVSVAYVELWSLKSAGKHDEQLGVTRVVEDGVPTYRIRMYNVLPKIPNGYLMVQSMCLNRAFEQITRDFTRPDIIHAHSCLMGGYLAMKLSEKKGVPFVVTEHRTAFARGLISPQEERVVKTVMSKAAKTVVVGPGLYQSLASYGEDKLMTIPNLVNVDDFKAEEKKTGKPFRFLSIAFLNQKKGMDILIRAFAKEFQGDKGFELAIGGDGPEKASLQALAAELGVSEQVRFLGQLNRDEVKREIANCHAFVLASRFETFGIVFAEALACGKPIIGTVCGGPEMIVNENNGYCVPKEDADLFARAMRQLVNQYDRFDPIAICQDCVDRFGDQAVVSQLTALYKTVIG